MSTCPWNGPVGGSEDAKPRDFNGDFSGDFRPMAKNVSNRQDAKGTNPGSTRNSKLQTRALSTITGSLSPRMATFGDSERR